MSFYVFIRTLMNFILNKILITSDWNRHLYKQLSEIDTENQPKHTIDVLDALVKIRMEAAKKSAKESDKQTRELYSNALARLAEEVVTQMPSANSFGKYMRNPE